MTSPASNNPFIIKIGTQSYKVTLRAKKGKLGAFTKELNENEKNELTKTIKNLFDAVASGKEVKKLVLGLSNAAPAPSHPEYRPLNLHVDYKNKADPTDINFHTGVPEAKMKETAQRTAEVLGQIFQDHAPKNGSTPVNVEAEIKAEQPKANPVPNTDSNPANVEAEVKAKQPKAKPAPRPPNPPVPPKAAPPKPAPSGPGLFGTAASALGGAARAARDFVANRLTPAGNVPFKPMKNPSCSCFMNSLLQEIVHNPLLSTWLKNLCLAVQEFDPGNPHEELANILPENSSDEYVQFVTANKKDAAGILLEWFQRYENPQDSLKDEREFMIAVRIALMKLISDGPIFGVPIKELPPIDKFPQGILRFLTNLQQAEIRDAQRTKQFPAEGLSYHAVREEDPAEVFDKLTQLASSLGSNEIDAQGILTPSKIADPRLSETDITSWQARVRPPSAYLSATILTQGNLIKTSPIQALQPETSQPSIEVGVGKNISSKFTACYQPTINAPENKTALQQVLDNALVTEDPNREPTRLNRPSHSDSRLFNVTSREFITGDPPPEVFLFYLKRAGINLANLTNPYIKTATPCPGLSVTLPWTLNLDEPDVKTPITYDISAITLHSGGKLATGGHYKTVIKDPKGKWWIMDDGNEPKEVTAASIENVLNQTSTDPNLKGFVAERFTLMRRNATQAAPPLTAAPHALPKDKPSASQPRSAAKEAVKPAQAKPTDKKPKNTVGFDKKRERVFNKNDAPKAVGLTGSLHTPLNPTTSPTSRPVSGVDAPLNMPAVITTADILPIAKIDTNTRDNPSAVGSVLQAILDNYPSRLWFLQLCRNIEDFSSDGNLKAAAKNILGWTAGAYARDEPISTSQARSIRAAMNAFAPGNSPQEILTGLNNLHNQLAKEGRMKNRPFPFELNNLKGALPKQPEKFDTFFFYNEDQKTYNVCINRQDILGSSKWILPGDGSVKAETNSKIDYLLRYMGTAVGSPILGLRVKNPRP